MTFADLRDFLRDSHLSGLVALAVQTVGVVIWLAQMNFYVMQVQRDNAALHQRLEAIDSNGSRALSLVQLRQADVIATNAGQDQRIRDMESKIGEIPSQIVTLRGSIDVNNTSLRRLDEQQSRIIQALDNTYNMLQEAIRGDTITRKPILPPSQQPQPQQQPQQPQQR